MVDAYAEERSSEIGEVGRNCRIIGARFIREVRIGNDVQVDGASILENATLCDGARVGVDVKAYDLIAAEGSVIDNGSIVERCFVGESCRLDKVSQPQSRCSSPTRTARTARRRRFSPVPTRFRTTSRRCSSRACSRSSTPAAARTRATTSSRAAPCTSRCTCAAASSPAGPTSCRRRSKGPSRWSWGTTPYHHDTSSFPYSYLIEKEGRSHLMPGANLTSFGAVRDIEKWPARDRRDGPNATSSSFEEYNPYITGAMLQGREHPPRFRSRTATPRCSPTSKADPLRRPQTGHGKLYNKAIVAALGAMLDRGESDPRYDGTGRWLDLAGQYITRRAVEEILDAVERGELADLAAVDNRFRVFEVHYDDYAHSWAAKQVYAALLGHTPTIDELERRHHRRAQRPCRDAPHDRCRPGARLLARHGRQLRTRLRRARRIADDYYYAVRG